MEHETAGDPVSGCKWTRKTTAKIAQQLRRAGIRVSAKTAGRLLKQMNFSLRLNLKCLESGQSKPPDPRQRGLQFRYIRSQIRHYKANAMPVISVDTKSRELIGPFRQAGLRWSQEPYRFWIMIFLPTPKELPCPTAYMIFHAMRALYALVPAVTLPSSPLILFVHGGKSPVHTTTQMPTDCSFSPIAVEAMVTEHACGNINCKSPFVIASVLRLKFVIIRPAPLNGIPLNIECLPSSAAIGLVIPCRTMKPR